tara:strand:+ start:2531 stop:2695 length:165 start_codon:yes stop_codon:yes gene_type:complete
LSGPWKRFVGLTKEDTHGSMDKIGALRVEMGATLWIEHDMEFARTLKKAPNFYQ